jgi:uncharacterized membrane protein
VLSGGIGASGVEELTPGHGDQPALGVPRRLGWRLRRNYLWIYAGVLLTWIAKLDIAGGPSADLIAGAAVGRTPGLVV